MLPVAHAVPEQQACPGLPHVDMDIAQIVPPEHASPLLQVSPMQHGWPSPPHAAHALLRQIVPPPHVSPGQHGCPDAPQVEVAVHIPALQIEPEAQADDAQQRWPGAPHATHAVFPSPQTMPAAHTMPELQQTRPGPQTAASMPPASTPPASDVESSTLTHEPRASQV